MQKKEDWGIFEPLHGPLGPVADILRPIWRGDVAVVLISLLLFLIWFRGPSSSSSRSSVDLSRLSSAERIAAYEELWRQEESELWTWLEDRAGIREGIVPAGKTDNQRREQAKSQKLARERALRSGDQQKRLREERVSEGFVDEAIRVTEERLEGLKGVVERGKGKVFGAEGEGEGSGDGADAVA